jgi:hypothetical protein
MLYDRKLDMTQAQRLLWRAAELIEERGLARDTYGGKTEDDPVCAVMAVRLARDELGAPPISCEALWMLMQRVGSNIPGARGVMCWSDANVARDVIAVMRELATTVP